MKKVLSFCIFGNKPMYDIGAIKNAKLAKEIFTDFECRFYVPTNYNNDILIQLKEQNAIVIEQPLLDRHLCTLWRLLPCFENDIDLVVCRDTDSRLTLRDYNIVDKFIDTDYIIQNLEDHEAHKYPELLAGMISIKNKNMYSNFKNDFEYFIKEGYLQNHSEYSSYGHENQLKGCDQIFLSKYVYVNMKDKIITYSDLTSNKIGYLENKTMFIGNIFNENDIPVYTRGY